MLLYQAVYKERRQALTLVFLVLHTEYRNEMTFLVSHQCNFFYFPVNHVSHTTRLYPCSIFCKKRNRCDHNIITTTTYHIDIHFALSSLVIMFYYLIFFNLSGIPFDKDLIEKFVAQENLQPRFYFTVIINISLFLCCIRLSHME